MSYFNGNNLLCVCILNIVSVFATYWNLINHSFTIFINFKYNRLFRKQFKEIYFQIFKFLGISSNRLLSVVTTDKSTIINIQTNSSI